MYTQDTKYQIPSQTKSEKAFTSSINPILTVFSGYKNYSKLKTLLFLINTSANGYKRISYRYLSRAVKLSPRQTIRIIHWLIDRGYLTKVEEKHTLKNLLPNLYIISNTFRDTDLLIQLQNMVSEYKTQYHHIMPINTQQFFDVIHINNNKGYINNLFIKNQSNEEFSRGEIRKMRKFLKESLFTVEHDSEVDGSRRLIPKRERKLEITEQKPAMVNSDPIESKSFSKSKFISYLDQFKNGFIKEA